MTATLVPDFSITFNQRRWACVLDPTLALSDYGLPLVKQLGQLVEFWIVREFWHILDNTQLYFHQPELILGQTANPSPQQQTLSQHIMRALKEWDRLRTMGDRNTWNIHFLNDIISESCLPPGLDTNIIWHWESLAQSLDALLENQFASADTLTLAFRDLAALAAARPACILTHRSAEEVARNDPPRICSVFEHWGIPCQEIPRTDESVDVERKQFRNLLVHAGLSKFLWAGLNLVVVHLAVPSAASLSAVPDWTDEYAFPEIETLMTSPELPIDLWEGSQGFWYAI
jgi:hypothetical protein